MKDCGWLTDKCLEMGLQVIVRMSHRPLSYLVYDHESFTRGQAPWGDEKVWSTNHVKVKKRPNSSFMEMETLGTW